MNIVLRTFIVSIISTCAFSGACADEEVKTYQNPVIKKSLPDPTVIKAQDGKFYLYATEDTHNVPIYSSTDLVKWRYAGTAFTDATRPMDMVVNGGIWAPEINYINGQYVLYYSKSEWGKTWECGIGVAVSDRPNGGFHDAHKLFISSEMGLENCIDPCFFQDGEKNYLFFGSFHDIYGIELTSDGLAIKEGARKFKIAGGLMEATMIVKHDNWYYLIGSAGSCCEGVNSTYRLVMARSRRVIGPYVDRNGRAATTDNMSPLLNKSTEVVGPGHCSQFVEDNLGQTWVLYHGFQADNIDAGRVTYLDRIVWDNDGWPTIANMKPSTEAEVPYFGTPLGIDDAKSSDDNDRYTIQPIDGCGMFRIDSPDTEPFTWQLYNTGGRLISKGRAYHTAIVDTSSVGKGMYVIKVNNAQHVQSDKILKL